MEPSCLKILKVAFTFCKQVGLTPQNPVIRKADDSACEQRWKLNMPAIQTMARMSFSIRP
jgi:hypothetical protein